MSLVVGMKVKGGKRVTFQFKQLSKAVGAVVLKQAALAGAEPMTRAAIEGAPRRAGPGGGRLKREIRARVEESSPTAVSVGVSWRRSRFASRTPAFYGLFIHEGTRERVQKTTGRRTGRMRKNPFLRRAFDAKKDEAARITKRVYTLALIKAVRSG